MIASRMALHKRTVRGLASGICAARAALVLLAGCVVSGSASADTVTCDVLTSAVCRAVFRAWLCPEHPQKVLAWAHWTDNSQEVRLLNMRSGAVEGIWASANRQNDGIGVMPRNGSYAVLDAQTFEDITTSPKRSQVSRHPPYRATLDNKRSTKPEAPGKTGRGVLDRMSGKLVYRHEPGSWPAVVSWDSEGQRAILSGFRNGDWAVVDTAVIGEGTDRYAKKYTQTTVTRTMDGVACGMTVTDWRFVTSQTLCGVACDYSENGDYGDVDSLTTGVLVVSQCGSCGTECVPVEAEGVQLIVAQILDTVADGHVLVRLRLPGGEQTRLAVCRLNLREKQTGKGMTDADTAAQ